ncbi:hypothetical protein [Alteromonas sp. S167]|uniref:hypothetical protein n=1 Tax=Alteromonas sp. S167 TaxID=3117402 RepID=UPI002FDF1A0D
MNYRNLLVVAFACALLTPFSYVEAESHDDNPINAVESNKEEMLLKRYFKQGEFSRIVDTLAPIKSKTPQQYSMLVSSLMNIDLDDAEEAAEQFIDAHSDNYKAYHMHASVMGAQASSSKDSAG